MLVSAADAPLKHFYVGRVTAAPGSLPSGPPSFPGNTSLDFYVGRGKVFVKFVMPLERQGRLTASADDTVVTRAGGDKKLVGIRQVVGRAAKILVTDAALANLPTRGQAHLIETLRRVPAYVSFLEIIRKFRP